MPYSLLEAKPIEELCKVVDCEHKTAPYVDESDYLVVRTSNVRDGQLVMESMKYTTLEGYNEWTSRAVPEYGDVLFTREAPAGESCLVPSDTKVCMGQRMVMLRPHKSEVDPVFLSMILNTERTKNDIYRLSIGSTVSRINIADIRKLKVASPPLPEQQKIAKILSTWDKAISTTERLIENSTQQKKALMQQLLTGKKRLLDESGRRFEGEWEEVKLSDLKLDISDGNYSAKYPKQSDFIESGIPFLRANNLRKGTVSDSDIRFISPKQHSEITKGHLKKGDILLSTRGELGNVALVPDRHIGSNINAQLVRINTRNKLSGRFLFQIFDYSRVTGKFESLSTGTALKQLPIGKLKLLELTLPTLLDEQKKIATVLTNADKEIELLEQQLADLQQEKKALMQQLLTGKKRITVI